MKFFDMFQYAFMNKAFLMGALIALCCSCLGLFLILRKYSMIGDGLGHVSFASVAVALLVGASDLIISIPVSYTHLDVYKRQIMVLPAFSNVIIQNTGTEYFLATATATAIIATSIKV